MEERPAGVLDGGGHMRRPRVAHLRHRVAGSVPRRRPTPSAVQRVHVEFWGVDFMGGGAFDRNVFVCEKTAEFV